MVTVQRHPSGTGLIVKVESGRIRASGVVLRSGHVQAYSLRGGTRVQEIGLNALWLAARRWWERVG